jgi:hypothetical protein
MNIPSHNVCLSRIPCLWVYLKATFLYRFIIYLFSKETSANLLNLYLAFLLAHTTLTICFLNLAKLCHYHNNSLDILMFLWQVLSMVWCDVARVLCTVWCRVSDVIWRKLDLGYELSVCVKAFERMNAESHILSFL